MGFPGGSVVKNPPAKAGDAGSIPVYNTALPSVCSISSSPTVQALQPVNPFLSKLLLPCPLSTDLFLSPRLIKLCCSLFFRLQPISSPLYISQRITQNGLHLLPHFLSTNSLFNPYYSADLLITSSKDLHLPVSYTK